MSEQYEPRIGDLVKHKTATALDPPIRVFDVGSKVIVGDYYRNGSHGVVVFDKDSVVPFVEDD